MTDEEPTQPEPNQPEPTQPEPTRMSWEDPLASQGVLHGVDDIPIVVRGPAARARSHAFILLRMVGVLALIIVWRSTSGVEDPDDVTGPMKVLLEFFGTLFAVFGTWRFGFSRGGPRRQEMSEQIATEHGLGALPPEHQRDAVSPPLWWLIVPATVSIFLMAGTVALALVSDLQGTGLAQALLVATGYAIVSVGLALLLNLGWLALGARLAHRPVTYLKR